MNRELLALSLLAHVGAVKTRILLEHVQDLKILFSMSVKQLCSIPGIGVKSAKEIHSFNNWDKVEQMMYELEHGDFNLISIVDAQYPKMLKELYDAPILIWTWGDHRIVDSYCLGIVGSRRLQSYSAKEIQRFMPALVAKGLCIVSGLAVGVDTLAHRFCLEEGGKTVAVLGSGFNRLYPAENFSLMTRIVENGGCIISEYPPNQKAEMSYFPTRNRIVSGLSQGIWVVESDIKGGSMITASRALEQNREVFATPHLTTYPNGRGCNSLIKKSAAKLVQYPEDILDELGLTNVEEQANPQINISFGPEWKKAENISKLNLKEESILNLCLDSAKTIDELIESLELDWNILQALLFRLELIGYLKQLPGARFQSC